MSTTVLVIEDADDMRDMLSTILSRYGYQVEEARDGLEGIKIARALHPAAIILDLMMPMAAGDFALGFLRSTPELKNTPVIVVSAHPKAQEIGEKLGAQAILGKPFDMRQLRSLLETYIPKDETL